MASGRSDGAAADREIVIRRTFDAPRALVFEAFTDRGVIGRWWGPRGFTITTHGMDVRPGGQWRFTMHGPDGTDWGNRIVYQQVARPERLVFEHGSDIDDDPERFHVTVTFVERGAKTEVVMRSVFRTAAQCEAVKKLGAVEGGMQTLDRLAEHLLASGDPNREIVVTRVFDAPRERVWEAWTDPEQVVRWWGPRGFTTTIHEMDVRPGGIWRHTMHGPDGTDYPNQSRFVEVARPERIVYTHGGGRQGGPGASFTAYWTFEEVGAKTRLTIRMVFPTAADRDHVIREFGALEGAHQTLARLGDHLAAGDRGAAR